MKKYLKLIRVNHWLKNGLIFLPIFFSGNLFNMDSILLSIVGFFAFSFVASSVYIINDINDIEADRKHPVKKNRPLASGAVKVSQAIAILALLVLASLAFDIYMYTINHNISVIIFPIVYLILNVYYSIKGKHIPIVDVTILVLGFLIRVLYGAEVINVELSNWLYLMVMFGSFYLVFGKRRNEMMKVDKSNTRKVLQYYNKDFLDKNMYVFLSLAIISYSLWCVDADLVARIGNNYMIWTVPIVLIIFLKYSLNVEGNSLGDPIDVVLSDKILILLIMIYVVYTTTVVYFL